ncbi:MAG: hypothetical protein ACREHE_16760 [Rhizomicrobium sp.]
MANVKWDAFSGEHDWNDTANWLGGSLPGSGDTAIIHSPNAFQVDIDSAISARIVRMDAFSATLMETSAGSIAAHTLDLISGTAIFDASNAITEVDIGNALVELGADGALGSRTIHSGGTIEAMTDITLSNPIDFLDSGIFEAASGHTLALQNVLTIAGDAVSAEDVPIRIGGTTSGIAGTIVLKGASFGGTDLPYSLDIGFGTVTTGANTHGAGAAALLSGADIVSVDGTLDLRHDSSAVTLHNLYANGTVLGLTSQTFSVVDPQFSGTLSGNFTLDVTGSGYLNGALNKSTLYLGPGTDALNIVGATGNVTVTTDSAANATISVGEGTTVHITNFTDGHLAAILYGDNLHFTYVSYVGGLEMGVHPHNAGEQAYDLYFNGIASSSQLAIGGDGHGHYEVTLAPSEAAPHPADDAALNHAVEVANLAAAAAAGTPDYF